MTEFLDCDANSTVNLETASIVKKIVEGHGDEVSTVIYFCKSGAFNIYTENSFKLFIWILKP